MKKMIFFTWLLLLLALFANAQRTMGTGEQRTGCNFIDNNTFTAPIPPYNPNDPGIYGLPFNLGYVPFWIPSHGSANIYGGSYYNDPPPFANAGYSRMFAGFLPDDGNNSEGIAQAITPLQQGGKYALSFFERMKKYVASDVNVDNFHIYLMHSADAVNFDPTSFAIPAIPASAQQVYCEQNISNQNWKQALVCFTANSNYDMIWMFPKCNRISGSQQVMSSILVSYPELISLDGFTAGAAPVPTQPNCTVDIGPVRPNCGVRNAIFRWFAPNDPGFSNPIAPSYALPSQQLSVDASIPANIGTWTLRMIVPGAQNYGSCGSTCTIQAKVDLPNCGSSWPKVYQGKASQYLGKDVSGNIFMYLHSASFANNFNHAGALPATQNTGEYTVQYSAAGYTNWAADGKSVQYSLNSGDVQLYDWMSMHNTQYVNGTTGNASAGPAIVPAGELIIAEAANGSIISRDRANFYVHTVNNTTTSIPLAAPYYVKFNPVTNSLLVVSVTSNTVLTLQQYLLQNNQLNLQLSRQLPNGTLQFLQMDNSDRLFVVQNSQVQECNYTANPVTFSTPSLTGFNNTAILALSSNNPYTESRCLVFNNADNYFYALDFASGNSRKIQSSGTGTNLIPLLYMFDGNEVYLAGTILYNTTFTIGNQTIAAVPPYGNSVFIAKFNLLSDFTRREAGNAMVQRNADALPESLSFTLSPNPATGSTLVLQITEKLPKASTVGTYRISIADPAGRILLQTTSNLPRVNLNITGLKPGLYSLKVMNRQGGTTTRMFIKE
ncbi:MAG: T9SS type A sorting domain-containing protein [Ferruginibacter sp.]|nr:T9SS type A sorting domain-containing protein [Ferruginibacter sp.]